MVRKILCVGLICVDIISVCKEYPLEDTDQRSKSIHWQRGGNAANTCTVLANLGSEAEFIGSVPRITDGVDLTWGCTAAKFALESLKKQGVHVNNIVPHECCDFPTSTITVNEKTGSRTILHFRGELRELKYDDLQNLDLDDYCWVHFEGRQNVEDMGKMMDKISTFNSNNPDRRVLVSLELEKPKLSDVLMKLCKKVDMVFMSKEFAMHLGYQNPMEAVEGLKEKLRERAEVVCTWGNVGAAYATNAPDNKADLVKAIEPAVIVDTIGAGDAFIAGVLHRRSHDWALKESVQFGCRVAEIKITGFGSDHTRRLAS